MVGINNLNILLKNMKPELNKKEFVFVTVSSDKFNDLIQESIDPKLIFEEKEGITLILEKTKAKKHKLKFESSWAMITLTINSDLQAIGFLATITNKLAENKISVNAISAYYHDHLYVPYNKKDLTMKLLKEVSMN